MHRKGHLFEKMVSDENLTRAITEVNRTHHWHKGHRPNRCTAWVERTMEARVGDLRRIITEGFVPTAPKVSEHWDASARKWRTVSEPAQWPDQYVHHALVQVLQPVMMRGMDFYCCGSIRGRGPNHARKAIARWMRRDRKGTKYGFTGDIRHFYDSLTPAVVMGRMRELVKDRRVLDLIGRVIRNGVQIGAYTSQWFANTVLQPLDQLIRQSGYAKHYVRYMDNLTIFGSNKRKLRRLKKLIEDWLAAHGLQLKGDWQIYPTRARLPDAVGYRYGRDFILPRKHNLIRLKRALARYRYRMRRGLRIAASAAAGLLSRLGQLAHCNRRELYRRLGIAGLARDLKRIVRMRNGRKEVLTWSMYSEQPQTARRFSRLRAASIPI